MHLAARNTGRYADEICEVLLVNVNYETANVSSIKNVGLICCLINMTYVDVRSTMKQKNQNKTKQNKIKQSKTKNKQTKISIPIGTYLFNFCRYGLVKRLRPLDKSYNCRRLDRVAIVVRLFQESKAYELGLLPLIYGTKLRLLNRLGDRHNLIYNVAGPLCKILGLLASRGFVGFVQQDRKLTLEKDPATLQYLVP